MKETRQKIAQPEPQVGIFWLFRDELIVDSTTLDKAEQGVGFLDHPNSHIRYWAELQREGTVPPEVEYEEPPRGRVVYNSQTEQFTLLADRCILSKPRVVAQILRKLSLPENTKLDTDSHYRCSVCLYGAADDDDE